MPTPLRKTGRSMCIQMDVDARELIPLLTDNKKSIGKLLSELVRAEFVRRETRAEMLAEWKAQHGE